MGTNFLSTNYLKIIFTVLGIIFIYWVFTFEINRHKKIISQKKWVKGAIIEANYSYYNLVYEVNNKIYNTKISPTLGGLQVSEQYRIYYDTLDPSNCFVSFKYPILGNESFDTLTSIKIENDKINKGVKFQYEINKVKYVRNQRLPDSINSLDEDKFYNLIYREDNHKIAYLLTLLSEKK